MPAPMRAVMGPDVPAKPWLPLKRSSEKVRILSYTGNCPKCGCYHESPAGDSLCSVCLVEKLLGGLNG